MAEAVAPRARRGARNHLAGLAGEDATVRFYEARGAEVLARRWRAPEGEIDLIVRDGGVIAFVEVKTGRGALRRDGITARQWARLEAAAMRYMLHAETGDAPVRFDAAFVGPDGAVDVVENARMSEAW